MAHNEILIGHSKILQALIAPLDEAQDLHVRLEIQDDRIKLILETPTTSDKRGVRRVWITYRPTDDGCLIENEDKQERVDGLDYYEVSVSQLEDVINTMNVLRKFSVISVYKTQDITSSANNLRTNEIFLEKLSAMLVSRQKLLNVFVFKICLWQRLFNNHAEILMSCLNSNFLSSIIMSTPAPGSYLNLDAIVILKQWINAEEIKMKNFRTSVKFDKFFNFSIGRIEIYPQTSYSELTLLKERFLNHEKPEFFVLNYAEGFTNRHVLKTNKLFGSCEHVKYKPNGDLYSKKWYFPVGDGEEFYLLVIYRPRENLGSTFVFKRVKASAKSRGSKGGVEIEAPTDPIITESKILQSIITEIEDAEDHSVDLVIRRNEMWIDVELGGVPNSSLYRAARKHSFDDTTSQRIFYKPAHGWCTIENDGKAEVSQSSVYKVSVVHLEHILGFTSVLSRFSIENFSVLELEDSSEIFLQVHRSFLETVEAMLKERSSLLKAIWFVSGLCENTATEHLPKILACLDPQILQNITLNGDVGKLHCDELINLEQWKSTPVLFINGFYVDSAITNFLHFEHARVTFWKITYDDLILLKEHFLNNATPHKFEINFIQYANSSEISNNTNNIEPRDVFGDTEHVEYNENNRLQKMIWYFRHKVQHSFDVRIEYCTSGKYTFRFGFAKTEKKHEQLDTNFNLLSLMSTNYQVVKSIIEKCSLVTILTLRKVCKTMRSFIDTKPFEFPDRKICITFKNDYCLLKVFSSDEKIALKYQRNPFGCMFKAHPRITYGFGDIETKMMTNDTPLNFCMRDLELILKHQKTPINELAFTVRSMDDEYIFRLKQALTSQREQLKVNTVLLCGIDFEMMTRILSSLDENELNKIYVRYDAASRVEPHELETGGMERLAQWNSAKELFVDSCTVSFPIESIGNFNKVEVCFRKITVKDLLYLKEVFINSTIPRKFYLKCKSFDAGNLYEALGVPYIGTKKGQKHKVWFFRMPFYRNRAIVIDYLERIEGVREITVFEICHVSVHEM